MKEVEYIKRTLEDWCKRFEGIHVRYAYDATTEYHIVEVDPENIRRGSEQYKDAEYNLWVSFMELFPGSDLLVTKPSSANDMTNCLFENRSISSLQITDMIEILIRSMENSQKQQEYSFQNDNVLALAA